MKHLCADFGCVVGRGYILLLSDIDMRNIKYSKLYRDLHHSGTTGVKTTGTRLTATSRPVTLRGSRMHMQGKIRQQLAQGWDRWRWQRRLAQSTPTWR